MHSQVIEREIQTFVGEIFFKSFFKNVEKYLYLTDIKKILGLRLGLETFHLGQPLVMLQQSIFNILWKTFAQAFHKNYFSPSLQPWISESTCQWKRTFLGRKLECHRKNG